MGKRIGIDLGGTYCVVAVLDGPEPKVLGTQPVHSIRRLIDRRANDPEVERNRQVLIDVLSRSCDTSNTMLAEMRDGEYSPVDFLAMILHDLKRAAESHLREPVTDAVIAVPACFTSSQMAATQKASEMAGLGVRMLLLEPIAAAIALDTESEHRATPQINLVCDSASDALHASIVMWRTGDDPALMAFDGDWQLGTEALLQEIVSCLVKVCSLHFRDRGINLETVTDLDGHAWLLFLTALERVLRAAQEPFTWDSFIDRMLTALPYMAGDLLEVAKEIDFQEYAHSLRPLMDISMKRLAAVIERVMERAGVTVDQLDHVLLIGELSGVPWIRMALESCLGPGKVVRVSGRKHAAALGAAVVAARFPCESAEPM